MGLNVTIIARTATELQQIKSAPLAGLALENRKRHGMNLSKQWLGKPNLFIYQARESSLVPAGFLTAQFLQKL